ncbi:MAG: gamma-glutamyltransferase [Byssovorax sp.]
METSTLRANLSSTVSALGALALLVFAAPAGTAGCGEPPPAVSPPSASASAANGPRPTLVDVGPQDTTPFPPPPAPPPKPHRFAVASENATASKIAMEVLARGGTAADAAVAGVLAVGVTQPVSSGIGGGGFALVWDAASKNITVLDFRETAPAGTRPNDFLEREKLTEKKRGVLVGVPGEIAGLTEIHKRWGKLPWSEVVRGPADAAESGFPLSAHLARALKWSEAWVLKTPRYGLFAPSGALAQPKDLIKNPALAATLRRIGAEGKSAFYEGAIARDVIETAQAGGSKMTAAELKGYRLIERAALHTTWSGYDVWTMPPPSAGGMMMLETLAMHQKEDLTKLGYGTGAYTHLLAETFRGAVADRAHMMGDPAFVKVDVAALASPERMKARRARIRDDATTPAEKFPIKEAGTSHLVVVDEAGNVVSITSTVNNMFGAKLVTAGGFVLNDELDDFTPAAIEKRFGVKSPGPNSPRKGARPASSMTPTIVMQNGAPVFALGGSGGTRIATGTTQVLLARLAFDRSPADAVADPRIETPPAGGLLLDASAPKEVLEDLQKRGEVVDVTKPNFSAVQAIAIGQKDGVRQIWAGADPRKGGSALVE